jgi:hypothetical protein
MAQTQFVGAPPESVAVQQLLRLFWELFMGAWSALLVPDQVILGLVIVLSMLS